MKSRSLLLLALLACQTACKADKPPASIDESPAVSAIRKPTVADSATIRNAQETMRRFFEASREGSDTRELLTELTSCDDDEGNSYFPTTVLGGYSLLPFEMRGDTVIAHASVVTVAEQDVGRRGASGFVARQRVREDVLEWDVYFTGADNWVVCNGLRFGYFGDDSLTTWRPEGSSYQTARALADSIWKARSN